MHTPPIPFMPPSGLRGRHVQTLLGHLLPSSAPAPGPESGWESLDVPLADGDVLRAQVSVGDSGAVIYVFHGLGGCTASGYMRRASALFRRMGHTVLAVDHRGAGRGIGLAARPYHMGSTSDMAAVLARGRTLFPDRIHGIVGFSMSASILLLLLGRDQAACQPDVALAVNPPFDLEKASQRLCRGFNRLYDRRFVGLLMAHLEERKARGMVAQTPVLRFGATLREFDEIYTARAAGFRNRDDYYARCSCAPWLKDIHIPTVLVTAEDDPFGPPADLDGMEISPSVHLHREPCGGHMGYLGRGLPGGRWLDHALAHYLRELLASGL